jgi:hypothetical protein
MHVPNNQNYSAHGVTSVGLLIDNAKSIARNYFGARKAIWSKL